MSVVYFPVCRSIEGRFWYGGRGFKSKEDWLVSMSDRDYRRVREWETRNMAWLASKLRHDGDKQQGGAA